MSARQTVTLCLDHLQMGVGGDDSWGARTHPEYCIQPGVVYEHLSRIEPIAARQLPSKGDGENDGVPDFTHPG